jgi:hypothetical protein
MKYIRPILRSKLFRFFFIIYLAFFVFDKAFSINAEFNGGVLVTGLTPGQLQHLDIDTLRYLSFDYSEFTVFSQYSSNNGLFRFYGHPGQELLQGLDLTGDLTEYDFLISWTINNGTSTKLAYQNWFNQLPSEPYPAEDDQQEDEPDNGGGGGSDFDINDIDYNLAATFFAGGFAIFLLPWLNAYGFSALLSFIKRA